MQKKFRVSRIRLLTKFYFRLKRRPNVRHRRQLPHHQQQRPGLVHNNKVRGGSRRLLSQRSIKVATTGATGTSTRSMKSYNSVQTQNSILFHMDPDDEDDG